MRQYLDRRTVLRLFGGGTTAAAAAALLPRRACAQGLPSRTITIVVPYQPGGSNDIIARVVAQHLTQSGRGTFVVENKPGAGGAIGTQMAIRAEPDGTTILVAPSGILAINKWIFAKLPYDPDRDLAPLSLAATVPNVLVVHPSVPARNVRELVAYAKANPGKLNLASMGSGTSGHLCGEMMRQVAGIDFQHVPYKGSAPALNDLLGGQVQMMFDNLPTALPYIQSEKLRALAVTGRTRNPQAPTVPTMKEDGLDIEAVAWFGFVAPAKTPEPIRTALADAIGAALADPGVRDQLQKLGLDVVGNKPGEFRDFIAAESEKWKKVVQIAGLKLEE